MSAESKRKEIEKARKRMKSLRQKESQDGDTLMYKNKREIQKLKMRKLRENKTKEEKKQRQVERNRRIRKLREKRTPEEKMVEKQKAKERMRKLRKERLLNILESSIESLLSEDQDIVCKLNQKYRNKKEIDRKAEKEIKCDVDNDCKDCEKTYEKENDLHKMICDQEKAHFDKKENLQSERKPNRIKIKKKIEKSIPSLPARELSEYEKIREEIIAQRKKEWLIFEKEWEKKWEESRVNK